MPSAVIDEIETRYEIFGDGPPVLMFSPGGFDASLDKWSTLGVYARIKLLDHLPKRYRCIIFDRRETGRSGGRVERISWRHYAAQGKGLLEHLGIEAAHLLGGCMGCCPVTTLAVEHPQTALSMILYWPVGGARYRIRARERFDAHLAYVAAVGLDGVVDLARGSDVGFGKDPRIGPWAPVLRNDADFAAAYARLDVDDYARIIEDIRCSLIDRDTAPGPEPEELMSVRIPALIVPGKDPAHATSAARYLEECLPESEYWDIEPESQTEDNVPARLLDFLDRAGERARHRGEQRR